MEAAKRLLKLLWERIVSDNGYARTGFWAHGTSRMGQDLLTRRRERSEVKSKVTFARFFT